MKRTTFAQQGIDFVTLFSAKFSHIDVSGYTPLMRDPPGETTGAGKQAIQHVVLYPRSAGAPLMTIGAINVATRSAKVRTFGCLLKMHQRRFGDDRMFVLHPSAYQELFDALMSFLKIQGMVVDIESQPPEVDTIPPRPVARLGSWVALVLWIAVAGVLSYLAVTRILRP